MSRYIDADKALKDADTIDPKYAKLIEQVKNIIKAQPTADVVEVVRCKDCKYKESCCQNVITDPDWSIPEQLEYCSYGEREEVDNECK